MILMDSDRSGSLKKPLSLRSVLFTLKQSFGDCFALKNRVRNDDCVNSRNKKRRLLRAAWICSIGYKQSLLIFHPWAYKTRSGCKESFQ